MSYRIGNIPSDPAALPQFLQQELARIQELWNSPLETLPLAVLYKAPVKPRPGIYLADGTRWDPGEGAGFYGWRDGAYYKLDCPCSSTAARVLVLGNVPADTSGTLYVFDTAARSYTAYASGIGGIAISPDGTVFTGIYNDDSALASWIGGVRQTDISLSGVDYPSPVGITNDGSRIAGTIHSASPFQAVYWDNTGIHDVVSGDSLCAAISGDGAVIAADYYSGGAEQPALLVSGVRVAIGSGNGRVMGISNNGLYACGFFQNLDLTSYAFVYNVVTTALTTAATDSQSQMVSVSNAGVAVGTNAAGTGVKMLSGGDGSLVPLPGFVITYYAASISPDGRVIAMYPLDGSGLMSVMIDESVLIATGLRSALNTSNVLS